MTVHSVVPLLVSGFALAQTPGTFTATASMITPRFSHTATLLPSGMVLIAGGNTACPNDRSCIGTRGAELYDPVTGSFAATGSMSMTNPKGGILLPDGRVLFVGKNMSEPFAHVEIYEPSSGNFVVAGNSKTLDVVSSATLLIDGRVLFTGWNASSIPRAELYDPGSGSFVPIANWPAGAEYARAFAALADGRILFETGALYDPATGMFSDAVGQGLLKYLYLIPPAKVLLNGQVLFAGGSNDGGNVSEAELYDLPAGMFAFTGSMSVARNRHSATLLPDGTVLIAGGQPIQFWKDADAIAGADLYDPATGTFSAIGDMATRRLDHAAVLLTSGQILITGGAAASSQNGSESAISSAELYTPAVLIPAPVLFSLSGDGQGQGAVWHATTGVIALPSSPAVAGEILSMCTTSLADGSVIPPQAAIGGRLAEVLYFGDAPGCAGYQVNFQVPEGVASGPAVSVRLTYLGRSSNEVTIAVQ
jgi:hypothetical protein